MMGIILCQVVSYQMSGFIGLRKNWSKYSQFTSMVRCQHAGKSKPRILTKKKIFFYFVATKFLQSR